MLNVPPRYKSAQKFLQSFNPIKKLQDLFGNILIMYYLCSVIYLHKYDRKNA